SRFEVRAVRADPELDTDDPPGHMRADLIRFGPEVLARRAGRGLIGRAVSAAGGKTDCRDRKDEKDRTHSPTLSRRSAPVQRGFATNGDDGAAASGDRGGATVSASELRS